MRTVWEQFSQKLHYFIGNLDVTDDFTRLGTTLQSIEPGCANRMYYLAISPEYYVTTVENLGKVHMATDESIGSTDVWRRIIIEKPFR